MHRLIEPALAVFGGLVVSAKLPDVTELPFVENVSTAAVAGICLWWILGKLSRQLDSLQAAIEKLADSRCNKE